VSTCRRTREHGTHGQCTFLALLLVVFPLAMSAARSLRIASYTLAQRKRAIAALVMSFSLGFPVSSMRLTAR